MTIKSPRRRLRLFILSLSLFCSGVAVAQTPSPPAGPPGISVVDNKWLKVRRRDMSTPIIAPPQVDEKSGMVMPPNDNSNLRRVSADVPPEVRTKALHDDDRLLYNYFYWLKIKNESPRKIRSIYYDYVFVDPSNQTELKRYSMFTFLEIATNQTKWTWSGPANNPPQKVSVAGLEKGRRSPFDERVELKCLLFTDGTGWRSPDANQQKCDNLVKVTLENKGYRNRIDPGQP